MDINSENRDEIIFSYVEGLMDKREKAEFEALLQMDDFLRKEVTIFKRTAFVVAEPLSSVEDMSQELVKSNFSLKWLWAGMAGFLMVIGGVYAIFLYQSPNIDIKETQTRVLNDSISTNRIPLETDAAVDVTEKVDLQENVPQESLKSKREEKKSSKDTVLTSSTPSLPVETQEKQKEVPKVEDKKIPVADTLSKSIGLKVTTETVKDTIQPKKEAPAAPKTQKPKSVKKLNIKGTEDIKTNSSLY
ncbi:MAG: hypothetical protein K2Q22_12070 [Cytophagales bacterium]|nr:hypothetical protein [Cytophagales bacterium]